MRFMDVVWVCMLAFCAGPAAAKPLEEEEAEMPQVMAVGLGLGIYYAPSLRVEVRPLPWVSIAPRMGLPNLLYQVEWDDGSTRWFWKLAPAIALGVQLSGIWPINDGHQVAIRMGVDSLLFWGDPCANSHDSCAGLEYVLWDGSVGYGWQSGPWEARADLGAGSLWIEGELSSSGGNLRIYPTVMLSGLYWFL